MSDKQDFVEAIIDVVYESCVTRANGNVNFSREELLGNCRKQSVVMTRCMLAMALHSKGYSKDTIAMILGKTEHQVNRLLSAHYDFEMTSHAYRVANAEAVLRCQEICIGVKEVGR